MRFIIIPWNPFCSVGFGIRSKWISALKEHWGNKLLSNNIMGICVLFKSCLVMRKKVLHLQLVCIYLLSFVWQNLPSEYLLWRLSTIFANFFCSWKRKILSKFLIYEGKKKNRQKKNSNFLRFAKNCNEVPVFMMELCDWPRITNKFR